mmetsp:Transcript_6409/g.16264  ORF Transcript_6409/g.16264 Transcript_6409/m.16264 type:complete len:1413 (+) Transcript_6409:433-4671(+)
MCDNDIVVPRHDPSSSSSSQSPPPPPILQSTVSAPIMADAVVNIRPRLSGGLLREEGNNYNTSSNNDDTSGETRQIKVDQHLAAAAPVASPSSAFSSPSPFRSRNNNKSSNGFGQQNPLSTTTMNHNMMTIQRTRSLDDQALSESGGSSSMRVRNRSIFGAATGAGSCDDDINGHGSSSSSIINDDNGGGFVRRNPTQRFLFGDDYEFLDGGHHNYGDEGNNNGDNFNDISSSSALGAGAGAALHSSFDASMLRGGEDTNNFHHADSVRQALLPEQQRDTNLNELSGRKHYLRPRTPVDSSPDATTKQPPRTVRKTTKSEAEAVESITREEKEEEGQTPLPSGGLFLSTDSPGPARPRRLSTTPKPTPGTAAKRRRAPTSYRPRQSPMRRVPPNTPAPFFAGNNQIPPSVRHTSSALPSTNPFLKKAPATDDSHDANGIQYSLPWSHGHEQTPAKKSIAGGSLFDKVAPAAEDKSTPTPAHRLSQLEATFDTTDESNSVETSSPARFRFSAFPASLPRVNNPRSSVANTASRNMKDGSLYPDSVRKHMTFSEQADHGEPSFLNFDTSANAYLTNNTNNKSSDLTNQSRDDDGTQNTSISSLSAEGGGGGHHKHLPDIPGQTYPSKSILFRSGGITSSHMFEDKGGDDHDGLESRRSDLNGQKHEPFNGYNSKNKATGPPSPLKAGFQPPKPTNRHIAMNDVDLSKPYDNQKRINSFPSSLSSNTQMNLSDEAPSLSPPGRSGLRANFGIESQPDTPREVQFHFPPDTECSPIPNPKEQRVHQGHHMGDHVDSSMLDRNDDSSAASSALIGDGLLLPGAQLSAAGTSSVGSSLGDHSTKISQPSKKDAGSMGSDTSQQRSVRPMPDMSAFESVASQSRDRSRDDTIAADSLGVGSTQRRICPPTPQRTPAWQGGKHSFFSQRSNSLVANKVLLAAPSQVLKGRSSLESSVLDKDSKPSSTAVLQNDLDKTGPGRFRCATRRSDANQLELSEDDMDVDDERGSQTHENSATEIEKINAPPRLMRRLPSPVPQETGGSISFANDFELLGLLGSGTFADVYKVRAKSDNRLYAVKRNRRQFRGKRDREMAMAEVRSMQRLQSALALQEVMAKETSYSLYLLFFYRAWQEDGYFYSQTELCCRDTCRELLDSLRLTWADAMRRYPSLMRNVDVIDSADSKSSGGIVPTDTIWKICHDIAAGLSHVHANGIVHQDLKPSNIFFVPNSRFGAMCKIGDFGMAGDIGSSGDGLEGDARYMSPELLTSSTRHPTSDIFSFGLTIYEIASELHIDMPSEGNRWHQLRSHNEPRLPSSRGKELEVLVQSMTNPKQSSRPTADQLLEHTNVKAAGLGPDAFLRDYLQDVQAQEDREAELRAMEFSEEKTPRNDQRYSVRSPSLSMMMPAAPNLLSPAAGAVGKS